MVWILDYRNLDGTGMGVKLMNPWEYCNSLRYGFDEEYDSPVFEDEDISEEKEAQESMLMLSQMLFRLSQPLAWTKQ